MTTEVGRTTAPAAGAADAASTGPAATYEDAPGPTAAPPAPSFGEALRFWLKLGFISFGGPAGQIAIMHSELVERRRWVSERRFLHALNYCMVLPGPEAQQLATYLGWLLHRTWGGIVAGALFVLPSLVLLVALAALYMAWGQQPLVAGLFYGIKPAVTAIVLHAAWRIGSRVLHNASLWAIAVGAFVAIFALHWPFPLIVGLAALAGWIGSHLVPAHFAPGGGHGGGQGAVHGAAKAPAGPAVIDDDTPPPAHARFSAAKLAAVVAAGLALWSLPFVAIAAWHGWHATLTQMAWFFTKAALLTFGGAYAVLPYVYDGAVAHFGWLTASQMIDGLALGETTPGPLIMVVAFVAFVGGWTKAVLGPEALVLGGALAAVVVTWFTFLPSFLFILAGAPLVESTRGSLRLAAPLTAITAAVVGVIVNLALFFGWHVLWPRGLEGPFEWPAALIAIAAAVALLRFKRGVLPVIAASALAGLLVSLGWPVR
ncbi:MAG: chromate efflux transporter [Betaproteobacteria bacterium]|nr:chromate efflux transporter [Betaproteobacteria bacterium]